MDALDLEIAQWVADHRTDPLTDVCRFLEDLGTSWAFVVVVGVAGLGVLAWLRLWAFLPGVLLAGAVLLPVNGTLKSVFDRPRPPADLAITVVGGQAMPSSHAVMTSAVVTAAVIAVWRLSVTWRRIVTLVGVVGCLASAAATIYLGGHWLSDVLVGWLLGVGVTATAMLLWQKVADSRRGSAVGETV